MFPHHVPIMLKEIQSFVENQRPKKVIDLTFGAGGHSRMFLKLGCQVSSFDRDPSVRRFAEENIQLNIDKFSNFYKYENDYDISFADFGVSTMQLQEPRGFSFMNDSLLDMRMGGENEPLSHVLNRLNINELEYILRTYGEVVNYRRVAYNIDRYRLSKDITTTLQLREASGTDNFKILARIFQAFRIYINDEIGEINSMLSHLQPKLGALFLTFHSLEDRIIKRFCNKFEFHGFLVPAEEEIASNPKSRSAKLRFGFKQDPNILS
jgi:16S rRNA (cytosine1402-N4)-methyltransferase